MMGYYDAILGLIPLTLVGFSGALYGIGLGLTTAVPIGAAVAAALVAHAMFVNAPVDVTDSAPSSQRTPSAD